MLQKKFMKNVIDNFGFFLNLSVNFFMKAVYSSVQHIHISWKILRGIYKKNFSSIFFLLFLWVVGNNRGNKFFFVIISGRFIYKEFLHAMEFLFSTFFILWFWVTIFFHSWRYVFFFLRFFLFYFAIFWQWFLSCFAIFF